MARQHALKIKDLMIKNDELTKTINNMSLNIEIVKSENEDMKQAVYGLYLAITGETDIGKKTQEENTDNIDVEKLVLMIK